MFKNNIMAQYHINGLHNTKEGWWVLPGRILCQLMEQLRPKTGNTLKIYFSFIYFMNIMSS